MKHSAQNPSEDELPDDEGVDKLFAQLKEFQPPADAVKRVMQAVSRLPLPQMLQSAAKLPWDDDDFVVHHEHKRPS